MFPADLTPGFSREAMEKLLLAAATAYSKPSEAEAIARANGATEFYWISDAVTDTQCFVAANATDVVIAFRGTESVKDWLTDCKFARRASYIFSGTIHDGFLDAFNAVSSAVVAQAHMVGLGRRIWVTGHSLGGALATLCAYDLASLGLNVVGVYTFGQPRVGDATFADAYDARLSNRAASPGVRTPRLGEITFRLVNEEDIVPRVPGVLIGYRHCGREIFLDEFGGVEVDPSFWRKLASDVTGIGLEVSKSSRLQAAGNLVRDHFIAAYQKRILSTEGNEEGSTGQTENQTQPTTI